MPNLWTHILFGQQILTELKQKHRFDINQHGQQLYHFACQGPDFLLYHNFLPWKKDKRVVEVGELMHNERCGVFLVDMIEYVDKHKQGHGEENQVTDPLLIYALGFISHYVLDRHVHPYVYYHSGYAEWQHQRFEVMMDTLIVDKLRGLATWKTPSWKQIYLGKQLPEEVVSMLKHVSDEVYPEVSSGLNREAWHTAYTHMYQAHWLFHDPYGWKRVFTLGQINPLVYKRHVPAVDILNEANREWFHPAEQEELFTYSVWDLWELAFVNAVEVYQLVLQLISLDHDEDKAQLYTQLAATLGNYSYDSGKPCGEGYQLRFADPLI